MTLVTPQTGPSGKLVRRVLIEEALAVNKELYLGMALDREKSCVTVIASEAGGMDIEVLAAKMPHKIIKIPVDPRIGIQAFQRRVSV